MKKQVKRIFGYKIIEEDTLMLLQCFKGHQFYRTTEQLETDRKCPVCIGKEIDVKLIKKEILIRDNYTCTKCGSKNNLQIHHIIYHSNGGKDTMENLITLCKQCHAEKHKNDGYYNFVLTSYTIHNKTKN